MLSSDNTPRIPQMLSLAAKTTHVHSHAAIQKRTTKSKHEQEGLGVPRTGFHLIKSQWRFRPFLQTGVLFFKRAVHRDISFARFENRVCVDKRGTDRWSGRNMEMKIVKHFFNHSMQRWPKYLYSRHVLSSKRQGHTSGTRARQCQTGFRPFSSQWRVRAFQKIPRASHDRYITRRDRRTLCWVRNPSQC